MKKIEKITALAMIISLFLGCVSFPLTAVSMFPVYCLISAGALMIICAIMALNSVN